MHTTSLNINQEIFKLIEDFARQMNIPVSVLIKRLIARFSKRYTSRLEYRECSVTYQPKSKEWHLFIITYTDEEYEQTLDVRKVWKLSLSFFVTMAFLHYQYCSKSGDVSESLRRLKHSYMISEYNFQKNMINGTMVYTLIWGNTRPYPLRE